MARPKKSGLDYFPFDVHFFEDELMTAISDEFGIVGEWVAVRLLCSLYRKNYYLEWSELLQIKLLKVDASLTRERLTAIVGRLVEWGLFDEEMFSKYFILTSRDIQERYFSAVRWRKVDTSLPYLLIDCGEAAADDIGAVSSDCETATTEKSSAATETAADSNAVVTKSEGFPTVSHDFPQFPTNNSSFPQFPTNNVHKEKEIKEKENKINEKEIKEEVEEIKEEKIKENETRRNSDSLSEISSTTSTSTSTITPQGINLELKALASDSVWVEQVCRMHGMSNSEFRQRLEKFGLQCHADGRVCHNSLQDAKAHFNSWNRKIESLTTQKNADSHVYRQGAGRGSIYRPAKDEVYADAF